MYQLLREADHVEVHRLLSTLHPMKGQDYLTLYHAERTIVLLQELGVPLECSIRREAREAANYAASRVTNVSASESVPDGNF